MILQDIIIFVNSIKFIISFTLKLQITSFVYIRNIIYIYQKIKAYSYFVNQFQSNSQL